MLRSLRLHNTSHNCCKNLFNNYQRMLSFVNTVPASIGDKLSTVDTPALIVSRKALLSNLQKMKDFVDEHNERTPCSPISYRPHTKTHKCPQLAKLQIEVFGAKGVCVQVLDEAEAMLKGGIQDIFISNQIVGAKKISRLCELAKLGQLSVIVDNMDNLLEIAAAAQASTASIDVLIEVNAGQNRCGVEVEQDGGQLCVELAHAVRACPHLFFKGVHCYHGGIQHTREVALRQQQVLSGPVARANMAVKALEGAGIAVQVVTGGGTGTFPFESASGRYTEVQPGSYCFMDVDYGNNEDGHVMFANALFLHTTVISKTVMSGGGGGGGGGGEGEGGWVTRVVLDAGTKASSYDSGLPVPVTGWPSSGHPPRRLDRAVAELQNGGDEHSVLLGAHAESLRVGDTLRLLPGHVDPTVNMHQYLVIVDDEAEEGRGGEGREEREREPVVVDVWSITGRSPGL